MTMVPGNLQKGNVGKLRGQSACFTLVRLGTVIHTLVKLTLKYMTALRKHMQHKPLSEQVQISAS